MSKERHISGNDLLFKTAGLTLIVILAMALTACGGSMGNDPSAAGGTTAASSGSKSGSGTSSDPPAGALPTATNGSLANVMGAASNGTLSGQGTSTLTFAISAPPQNGTATLTNSATGAFTYTSYPNFTGQDSFQFTVSDSAGVSQPATETVNVTSAALGAEQAVANLGVSLDWLCYWCAAQPFVNILQQAGYFGDLTKQEPLLIQGELDANGWPETDFGVFVATGPNADGGPGDPGNAPVLVGAYHLSFTGQATVSDIGWGSVTNPSYNVATNTTTATVNVTSSPNNSTVINLRFTNTRRTPSSPVNSGLTNIQLIRPQFAPNGMKWWDSPTQEFTDPFLNSLKGFSTIRYINWTHVIGSPEVNWSDRTPANWPIAGHLMLPPTSSLKYLAGTGNNGWYGTGASWESAIDVANATHTDMWINIPAMATDDYVKSLAALIKSRLNANLHVYVEWSDEIWNYGNPYWTETNYNSDQTAALLASNPAEAANYKANCAPWDNGECHVAERVMQFGQDFASVYGQAAINTTIRPVLCTQVTQPVFLEVALRFVALTYGPPKNYFYGTCGAPYWYPLSALPAGTTTSGAVAAFDQAISNNNGYLQADAATALFYGLHDLTYEGGPDSTTLAVAGDTSGQAAKALQAGVQMAPGMQSDVINGLTNAFANGIDLYMYYQNESPTYYGATTDPLDLETPKFAGLNAVAGQMITRDAGTTLPGTVDAGLPVFGIIAGQPVPLFMATGTSCRAPTGNSSGACTFNNLTAVGTGTAYLVNVPQAGNYSLSLVMDDTQANFAGSVAIDVDQKPAATLTIPRTPGGTPLTIGPATLSLTAGLHLIEVLNAGGGNYAIDGITATAN